MCFSQVSQQNTSLLGHSEANKRCSYVFYVIIFMFGRKSMSDFLFMGFSHSFFVSILRTFDHSKDTTVCYAKAFSSLETHGLVKNNHKRLRNDGYMHVTDTKLKEEFVFVCQSVYNIKTHISFFKLIQYRNTTPIDEMYGHISHCVNS